MNKYSPTLLIKLLRSGIPFLSFLVVPVQLIPFSINSFFLANRRITIAHKNMIILALNPLASFKQMHLSLYSSFLFLYKSYASDSSLLQTHKGDRFESSFSQLHRKIVLQAMDSFKPNHRFLIRQMLRRLIEFERIFLDKEKEYSNSIQLVLFSISLVSLIVKKV